MVIHVKASPLRLAATVSCEQAFITILIACLQHAQANLPAVLAGQMEGVHQMRVAFRRLRSALKLFRSVIPREASSDLVTELRWLNEWLGPARDWDVFLYESLTPLFQQFPHKRSLSTFQAKAELIRRGHHRRLQAALNEPRYQALLDQFLRWVEEQAWRDHSDFDQQRRLADPALEFTTPLLDRAYQRALKKGKAFSELSAEQRHALRIRIKEIRYALDFFASLYPTAAVKLFLGALAQLQDCLGAMNDIAVAQRLLDEMKLNSTSAARQVIEGWQGCWQQVQERHFHEVWQRFSECPRPWKP